MSEIALEILPDGPALAARAADLVAERLAKAAAARGRATLAVSGGSTPAAFLAALAERAVPWEVVHVFQVDERVAPPGHPDRNLTGLRAALLDRVAIPPGNVHPMPVEEPDPAAAAAAYADEIRAVTGPDAGLDIVHLGLGDDGHTASWPPGEPVVDATADVAVVGPFNGRLRMTLTPPAVNRAGWILWLIAGAAKAPVVARLLAGDPALPSSRVRRHDATLLADAPAATEIRPG
ncbi:MAG TPA: 6-phosphogluconolactonase [Acidimicrobiia bacterium]|nr:6-phosphogluconolactonase [Acidimicrobiia bacterium]